MADYAPEVLWPRVLSRVSFPALLFLAYHFFLLLLLVVTKSLPCQRHYVLISILCQLGSNANFGPAVLANYSGICFCRLVGAT